MTPEQYRRALRQVRPGDTLTTGINDPWTTVLEAPRRETVIARNRLIITTDQARYTFTGRELSLRNPFAFPRIIFGIRGDL